ncbi:MAG: LPXTG cell wall anchor domain-containing protein, partial [Clostridia bacterium]|nr:LPXTG cell wall anchor domain-containing protein [Clostridia bacterium]
DEVFLEYLTPGDKEDFRVLAVDYASGMMTIEKLEDSEITTSYTETYGAGYKYKSVTYIFNKNNENNGGTTTKDKLNINELNEQEAKTAKDKVIVMLGDENGYSLFTYDITLVNEQGVAYTKENFPAGGVDVVIPYPKGMNKSNYKYRLFHFANGVNGEATEIKPLELTDKGIKFHANSLSPFVLTAEKADTAKSPKAGESNAFVLSMLGIIAVAGMGLYAGKRQEN